MATFRNDYMQRTQPLRSTLRNLGRETVMMIDELLDESRWSRADRLALRHMLCTTASALLEAQPDDAVLRAVFDKHSDASFDAVKQEEIERLIDEAEELTGFDLSDEDIRTEEDLVQRMYERMAQREAEEEARRASRRESATAKRAAAAAQLVRQSLREIYRKLASAVHPDRESDPERRAAKNALMQRINRAYAQNDLLTLFEVQMELDQRDLEQLANLSAQRLKQYNKLLAQQLRAAKVRLQELQTAFRMDFDLGPAEPLAPDKLRLVIQRHVRALRLEIARQKGLLELLSDKAAVKRWLRKQRRCASDLDF